MHKIILAIAALLFAAPLASCETVPTVPTSPVALAQLTTADEQAAVAAQLGYKTWRLAVELGVKAGVIKGGTATKIRELDTRLYAALRASELAYESGNATSFRSAIANFNAIHESANAVLNTGS